ncbi:MAG: leucine-rich repeat domain-containing protein [Lachnospiraceae bacterium]|nr:leucine-rich repeat domain-containing protein [Lachnospiraceae bacterium]
MREVFNRIWNGILLVAFMVACMSQPVLEAHASSAVVLWGGDVTNTGLNLYTTPTDKMVYKAGEGTITWLPGDATTPAVLTLDNATIESGGILVSSDIDVEIQVIGTNRVFGNVVGCVMELEDKNYNSQNTTTDHTYTITGGGTLELVGTKASSHVLHLLSNLVISDVTIVADCSADKYLIETYYDLSIENATVTGDYEGSYIWANNFTMTGGALTVDFLDIQRNASISSEADIDVKYVFTNDWYEKLDLPDNMDCAVLVYSEDGISCLVVGDATLDATYWNFSEDYEVIDLTIKEGASLTIAEGFHLDLTYASNLSETMEGDLVVNGTVTLPSSATAEDIAKLNLTGDGAVVVAGASDTEESTKEKVYTTEGKELNVVAGLDFTNVGSGDGQTAATGDGYTWDTASKTLALSGAYITGSLNLPVESKVVVSGINIVTGDVTVAGTVSDAFTLSGEGKITSASKKYVSHIYGEPTFTWTETEDGYTAKAIFVCQGGEDTQTVDAKVTATTTEATYTAEGKVVYEAEVTFNGKDYTDSKEVVIPKNELMGVQIEDAKTKAIYKVTSVTAIGGTVEYVKHKSKAVKNVTIPKTITMDGLTFKVTSIATKAFKGYKKLSKVTVGNNVKTIGKKAFSGCNKLKTVKIGSNVTTIGDKVFYNCVKLTSITIPSKVSKIGKSAFEKCKKLKTVTIKSKKLTAKKVGAKAFKGIKSTATIKVPKKKYKTYKSMLCKKGVSKKARFKKI